MPGLSSPQDGTAPSGPRHCAWTPPHLGVPSALDGPGVPSGGTPSRAWGTRAAQKGLLVASILGMGVVASLPVAHADPQAPALFAQALLPEPFSMEEPPRQAGEPVPLDSVLKAEKPPTVTVDGGISLSFSQNAAQAMDEETRTQNLIEQQVAEDRTVDEQTKSARSVGKVDLAGLGAKPIKGALASPVDTTWVTSTFGYRINPVTGFNDELHSGLDYGANCGDRTMASAKGRVVEAGWSDDGSGNKIVVEHANGLKTSYFHLQAIGVAVGDAVNRGQVLGQVGTTGNSTGCHLHFEVELNGRLVNPQEWLK